MAARFQLRLSERAWDTFLHNAIQLACCHVFPCHPFTVLFLVYLFVVPYLIAFKPVFFCLNALGEERSFYRVTSLQALCRGVVWTSRAFLTFL